MANTRHVVYAILKFLDEQQRSPDLTPDAIESLEGLLISFFLSGTQSSAIVVTLSCSEI